MHHHPEEAGRSAQAEYDRRSADDAAVRAHNRGLKIAILAATPVVVYVLVRFGAHALLDRFIDRAPVDGAEPVAPSTIDTGSFQLAGLLLASVATVNLGRELFGKRQTTEAWAKGAAGERTTASTLSRLPDTYIVLHDLPIPGRRANIDHVVIGPTGVITVETKNYAHDIVIRNGAARSGRYPLGKVVDQALKQAAVVAEAAGCPALPLVAVQGAAVDVGWFGKPVAGGVRFTSNRRLLDTIRQRNVVLTPGQVGDVAARISARFTR